METQSKVLKWGLIIGIVIVLNLFFNYTLSLVYKTPEYNDFCPVEQVNRVVNNQQDCVSQGGQWNENSPQAIAPKGETVPAGYCNLQFTCGNNYDAARKSFERNIFSILIILGALCVLIGNLLKNNEVISNALSLGGVFSFIIASMRYWGDANDFVHVLILAIALALLIWIAMRKFKNKI